ncbi:MAG: hypothetical protein ACE5M4_04735 [Anaerolineales bacterium]
MRIGIVGPCAVGKTSLAKELNDRGYQARQIVQEHSYVPQMWERISAPDVLLYLDGSYETCSRRRQLNWSEAEYQEQLARLAHAREHCDIYLATDGLSRVEVLERVLSELRYQTASRR